MIFSFWLKVIEPFDYLALPNLLTHPDSCPAAPCMENIMDACASEEKRVISRPIIEFFDDYATGRMAGFNVACPC